MAKEWKAWKSALEIYFEAYDVTDQRKMRAKLLHFDGQQLQRVYENLPDSDKIPLVAIKTNCYDIAVDKLDAYFEPGRQYILERCRMRNIKQEQNERFSHFVMRIRQQLSDCGLEKYSAEVKEVLTEIFMIDTIVEGCSSDELRRRILQKDRLLSEIVEMGAMMEGVEQQIKDIGTLKTPDTAEKIFQVKSERSFRNKSFSGRGLSFNGNTSKHNEKFVICYRCGTKGHVGTSENCKARDQVCRRCNKVGHFEAVCRKRAFGSVSASGTINTKRIRLIESNIAQELQKSEGSEPKPSDDSRGSKEYYCFYGGNESNVVECSVGGIPLKLLVDSGSDINVIHKEAWTLLKQQSVKVVNMQKGSERIIRGYGSDIPLKILGTFEAETSVGSRKILATFYVVEGGQRCLLGDATAKDLGILKVGVGINQMQTRAPFGRIKDVHVQIHMDPSFKPVFQPVRRVPIPYEAAVNKKLEDLLAQDIIEVKIYND